MKPTVLKLVCAMCKPEWLPLARDCGDMGCQYGGWERLAELEGNEGEQAWHRPLFKETSSHRPVDK
jgi:hypothetical protein